MIVCFSTSRRVPFGVRGARQKAHKVWHAERKRYHDDRKFLDVQRIPLHVHRNYLHDHRVF